MPIKRSTYQSEETIESFYERPEWTGGFKLISKNMLKLIALINSNFTKTEFVVSTSHQRLCIQDKDDEKLNWIIIISNGALDEYYFEYKVPENKSPWDEAWMKGTAKNLNDAIVYLIKSMIETDIWKDNEELNELKTKYTVYNKT